MRISIASRKFSLILLILTIFIYAGCNSGGNNNDKPAADTVATTRPVSDTPAVAIPQTPAKYKMKRLSDIKETDSLGLFRDPSINIDSTDKKYLRLFISNENVYLLNAEERIVIPKVADLTKYIRTNPEKIKGKKTVVFVKEGTSFHKAIPHIRLMEFLGLEPIVIVK